MSSARPPRPATLCQRGHNGARCRRPFADHDPVTAACPNGHGTFYGHSEPSNIARAGQSFGEREAVRLEDVCRKLLSGAWGQSAQAYARLHAAEIGGLQRKAMAMRATIARQVRVVEGKEEAAAE